jgi:hypothetical protein
MNPARHNLCIGGTVRTVADASPVAYAVSSTTGLVLSKTAGELLLLLRNFQSLFFHQCFD